MMVLQAYIVVAQESSCLGLSAILLLLTFVSDHRQATRAMHQDQQVFKLYFVSKPSNLFKRPVFELSVLRLFDNNPHLNNSHDGYIQKPANLLHSLCYNEPQKQYTPIGSMPAAFMIALQVSNGIYKKQHQKPCHRWLDEHQLQLF